jgi:adenylate cyclase
MERRLAAVMIADVAGYGRLSRADDEGTRTRFQADLHEVFEPKIADHHGRLVKTMGDGLLVEFHSVVDARFRRVSVLDRRVDGHLERDVVRFVDSLSSRSRQRIPGL